MPHQCTNCDRTFADGSKEMLSGCPECGGTKFQFRPDGFGGPDSTSDGADATTGPEPTENAESPPDPTERPGESMTRTVGNAAATVRDLVSGSAGSDATQAKPPADAQSTAESAPAPDSSTAASATETSADAAATESTTSSNGGLDDDIIVAESEPIEGEDTAQADARSQLVEPDEIPDSEGFDPASLDESDAPPDADGGVDVIEVGEDGDGTASEPTEEPGAESAPDRTVADEPDAERADRPDLAELREELNDQFESIRVVEPGQYELNLMELYDREEYIIALQEDGRYSIQVPETWRQADA
ncbi:OapC/ArvC family zinc-ribbon domain-containing protein [Halosimplex amylolyticum]|uniref:OapC/ArvC family zinc-ribbon domain-containing protein n=1 Tax=Halosimplex amylolyticum TaxID=3396616 RepID=UPI003F577D07